MDPLHCALIRLDRDRVVVHATASAVRLLGGNPTGKAWSGLSWRDRAPEPNGAAAWLELPELPPRLVSLTSAEEADGWCALLDRTALAGEVEERARSRRLLAVRPVVSGIVHGLNNLLHLTLALASTPELQSSEDGGQLARRVESMGGQAADLLSAVREVARSDSLPARRERLGEFLDRTLQLCSKLAAAEGVGFQRGAGPIDAAIGVAPWPDVAQILLQLVTHLLASGAGPTIEIGSCMHRAEDDLVAIELRAPGSGEPDLGLVDMLAEPARSLGLQAGGGFLGDVEAFGLSLLTLRLLGGDVTVGVADGARTLRVVVPAKVPNR